MSFLRRLGLFAFPLGIVIFCILGFSHSVHAADTISTNVYQDSDNDGDVDRIRWTMDENVTACTYEAGDWTVNTAGSVNVSITGLSGTCNGTDAILYITVTADANETGGTTDPVISYANAVTAGSVTLASGAMSAKASQTATDAAAPVIYQAYMRSTTCSSGMRNTLSLYFTETMQFSTNGGSSFSVGTLVASTSTMGAMTTPRTVAGVGSWAALYGGDMVSSSATATTITSNVGGLFALCFNQPSSSYFSSGTTAPTTTVFTPVADATALKDLVGLAVNTSAPDVTTSVLGDAWDVTIPTIANTYSCDVDGDGDIDRIQVNASEGVLDASLTTTYFEGDNDSSNDGAGEETPVSTSTSTVGCDGSESDADANDEKFSMDFTSGISGTDAAYLNVVSGSVFRDLAGNLIAVGGGLGTENDMASPVLLTASPANGATGVAKGASLVLTFSESMASLTTDISPTATLVATGLPGAVVTLTHATPFVSGLKTFTITAGEDADTNIFDGSAGIVPNPFTFTVAGGSSSYTSPPATYSLTLTSPAATDSFTFGDTKTVTWTSTGSAMTYVSLYYSTDGGTTYQTIATDMANDGSYDWTVPDIDSSNVTMYITGSDLVTVLANDVSDIFTVHGTAVVVPPPVEVVEAPSSGTTGTSPVDGSVEDISVVKAGDVVKGLDFSTVYYIDDQMIRHPYMDAQTYFTYYDSFGPVINVTNATLPTLALGSPVLPKPGVTLVKIQSDNRVFALGKTATGTELRWVSSEAIALTMFGQSWSDYIIDIPPTLFPKFTIGADITTSEVVDRVVMKTRFALAVENPASDNDGDGITNAEEVRLGTSTNDADTDNDGFPDGLEVGSGHDPLTALDSDGDGYPDYLEILHGYDPFGPGLAHK